MIGVQAIGPVIGTPCSGELGCHPEQGRWWSVGRPCCRLNHLDREGDESQVSFTYFLSKPYSHVRLVPKLFYKCDQGQADPVVAVARDQSSVYLKLLMHETQPPSHFSVSTITRYTS